MKRLIAVVVASSLSVAVAQDTAQMQHAPDGGTMEQIMSIYISPVPNAPFSTTLVTEWTKKLEDGTTIVWQNHRTIMRDSAGRIYQERRRFAAPNAQENSTVIRIEITDPVAHVSYFCNPATKMCGAFPYSAPAGPSAARAPLESGANVQRIDLGKSEIAGVEVVGTRETTIIKPGAVGNDRPIELTKDIWYSARLDLNVSVKRVDPRHGTEVFAVKELSLAEPPPESFKIPAGYQLKDRASEPQNETAKSQ